VYLDRALDKWQLAIQLHSAAKRGAP
jgi:hypothetical protein